MPFGETQAHQQMFARGVGGDVGERNAASALLHAREPFLRQPFGFGRDAPAVDRQASMRAGPDAGVIAVAPIDEIVPALGAGARMVRNFVGGQARRPRRGSCVDFVELGRGIFVRAR